MIHVYAASALVTIGEGLIVAVGAALIGGMATITVKYFSGSHVVKTRQRDVDRKRDAALHTFVFGTPEDSFTGTPAIPGAIVSFPKLQKDVTEIKDMVGNLLLTMKDGNGTHP